MDNITVTELVDMAEESRLNSFNNNLDSNAKINLDYNNTGSCDWIDIFEETLPYLDTILRNPNRFIINEEEVVKIEQARRVTVESIKHLSQNTNLIQDIDRKTGDVKPSKILNVNKEETFETYENKFIYSLIQNMKYFITRKKRNIVGSSKYQNLKQIAYNGISRVGKENIDVSLNINSKIESNDKSSDNAVERIAKIEEQIIDLTYQQTYKDIERRHIQLVVSPIKKTNVILKNSNFQMAVKLWNYIQDHIGDDDESGIVKKNYDDDGQVKKYLDETFLLDYLITNSIETGVNNEIDKTIIKDKIAESMVSKMLDLDSNLTEEQLKELVGKGYAKIKYKAVANDSEIRKIFNKKMDKFLAHMNSLEW